MAHLKIYCGSCSKTWAVYDTSAYHDPEFRTCPHCGESIDQQTWEKQVLPALGQTSDANRELSKDHWGYKNPLFHFDVIADFVRK